MNTPGGFRAPPHATRPKGDDSIPLKCTLVGRDVTSTRCLCWGGPQKGQIWGHRIPPCSARLPAFWAKGIFWGNHPCFQASFQKKTQNIIFWQPLGYGRSLLTSSAGTHSGRHHPLLPCPHQQKATATVGNTPNFGFSFTDQLRWPYPSALLPLRLFWARRLPIWGFHIPAPSSSGGSTACPRH